jgi:hypothetical protein
MPTGNVNYNAVLADLEARKAQLDTMITGVKLLLASGGGSANGHVEGVISPENIPTHAFLTLSIADATKKFLDMVKSKQSVPQIAQALERGGLPPAKNNTVYSVLRRRESQFGDIIRVGDEWALASWYPNNPNLRKRTPDKTSPRKSKKKRAAKKTPGAPAVAPIAGKERSITLGAVVAKVLSEADGPLHVKEIAERIKKYGKTANARSLPGSLVQDSKKRFKNVGNNTWELAKP